MHLRRLRLAMNYYLKLKSSPENPAYDCVLNPNHKSSYEQKPNIIPSFGLRIKIHLQNAGINVDSVCDDPLETLLPPWKLVNPVMNFSLSQMKKDNTSEVIYKQLFLEHCSVYKKYVRIFTDGSKQDEAVAAAAVSLRHPQYPLQVRLPDSCSVFTAELRGILLALKHIYQSEEKYFLILSDSLSALQAISTRKITKPLLADIHDIHSKLANRGKIIVFFWVPSHMVIHGNDIVDKAAKSALHLDISEDLLQTVPYTDLRPKTKQYCDKLWQTEWSDQINNKLFLLCPDLSQPFPVVGANRKEETVLTRLHVGHMFATHDIAFFFRERTHHGVLAVIPLSLCVIFCLNVWTFMIRE